MAGAEQDREGKEMDRRSRPHPQRDSGDQRQRAADPGRVRVVAAVDVAADAQRRENRQNREAR
jgi:hypothetical protein